MKYAIRLAITYTLTVFALPRIVPVSTYFVINALNVLTMSSVSAENHTNCVSLNCTGLS